MSKLSRISVGAAFVVAVALVGAATTPAHAVFCANALTTNSLVHNALISNALVANGAQAAGQSALESLNGVAVEAVILPPEAGR